MGREGGREGEGVREGEKERAWEKDGWEERMVFINHIVGWEGGRGGGGGEGECKSKY